MTSKPFVDDGMLAGCRAIISQALEQAEANGKSVFIRDVLDDDMSARTAIATWDQALDEAKAWKDRITYGRRAVGKLSRRESAEIYIEIWPRDEEQWIKAPVSQN